MGLDDLRVEINEIDTALVELLTRRMDICARVAEYKKENGMAILQPEREAAVLDKVAGMTRGEYGHYMRAVYSGIMEQSRELQLKYASFFEKDEGGLDEE